MGEYTPILWLIGIALFILIKRGYRPSINKPTIKWSAFIPKMNGGGWVAKAFPALLFIAVITAIFLSWEWTKETFSKWLAASDGGVAMKLTEDGIKEHLWIWASGTIFVGVLLLSKEWLRVKLTTIIFVVMVIVMAVGTFLIAEGNQGSAVAATSDCLRVSELESNTNSIAPEGKCLFVQAGDRPFNLYVSDSNHEIRILHHKKEVDTHGDVVATRLPYDFLEPGKRVGATGQTFTPQTAEFNKAGLKGLKFTFIAVKP